MKTANSVRYQRARRRASRIFRVTVAFRHHDGTLGNLLFDLQFPHSQSHTTEAELWAMIGLQLQAEDVPLASLDSVYATLHCTWDDRLCWDGSAQSSRR